MALSSPPPPDGSQDLHENLHSIGDAAFLGYQINCKMSCTELNYILFFSCTIFLPLNIAK